MCSDHLRCDATSSFLPQSRRSPCSSSGTAPVRARGRRSLFRADAGLRVGERSQARARLSFAATLFPGMLGEATAVTNAEVPSGPQRLVTLPTYACVSGYGGTPP